MSALFLADFDFASQPNQETPLTPIFAAPEILDVSSPLYRTSTYAGDIFSLGATLLYIFTGQAFNSVVLNCANSSESIRFANGETLGWKRVYEENFNDAFTKASRSVPTPLASVIRNTLLPSNQKRPKATELEEQLKAAASELENGSFLPPEPSNFSEDPIGMRQPILDVFVELKYDLREIS